MDTRNVQHLYEHYLNTAQGKGPQTIHQGGRGQRGGGIGSFLKGLFRQVFPYLKGGAKALGEELLKGGVGLIKDNFKGKSLKESLGARVREAGSSLTERAARKVEDMTGGGRLKTRRKSKKRQSTTGRVAKRTIKRRKKTAKRRTKPGKRKSTRKTPNRRKKKRAVKTRKFADIFE